MQNYLPDRRRNPFPSKAPTSTNRLPMPVVIAPIVLIGRRVRKLSRDSQDRIADTSGLAGETLNFDVEITDVRDATEEELAHGHVHGAGGHHH